MTDDDSRERSQAVPAPDSAPGSLRTRQFLVLGVHRSGTSVLTETAIRLGLHGGDAGDLDGADGWNEKGYWEHRRVRALDEELLSATDSDWFCAGRFAPEAVPDDLRAPLQTRAREIVSSLDEHAPWIVKDPRLCVLLPFWLPFLSSPGFLFSLRDPLSVARSLRARDELPLPLGLALWETQLLAALASTRGRPRAAFWYEDLVASPASEGARLAAWLRAQGCEIGDPTSVPVATDPRLRHHVADSAEEEWRLPAGVRRLLVALRSGEAFGDEFDVTPSEDSRESVEFLDRTARTRRFLESGWLRQRAAHGEDLRTLEETIRAKDEQIANLSRRFGDRVARRLARLF